MFLPGSGPPLGAKGHLQRVVDLLHHAIGLGQVGRGGDVLDPLLLTPVSLRTRGELGPPVGGDAGWCATHVVMNHERLQDRVKVNATQGDHLWPPGTAVNHSQQVN